ncbi:hybrid sensor histidine kinase/response regulator [Leptolyngbya sp. GGD]|uniref:hybrid sensor histidine kinase/response regulator n=1 Tax=Leptolyngbya sp. GGD TaxID=2997907 RepID=UPI00227CCA34|nr:ATP-binding protein [Leptolyngbya sp. GGD]MCY6490203.1 ATP-binding protein [Leptolyngbya sp. GGD]
MSYLDDRFSLLDQMPLGICVLRSDYQVVFWNSALEEWTQIGRKRIEGQAICDFFPHFRQSLYTNRLAPIFEGGPPTIFSSQLHKYIIPTAFSDGRQRIQHTTVTSIPATQGDGFYAMLSIQDVTDLTFQVQEYRQMRDRALAEAENRKLAQESAEVANRVKDEFLAIVSHELRTPLNPILGWSKLLCEGKLSGEVAQRALNTIFRNAALQVQLIDDLLDVSRILRGKLSLKWGIIDLIAVVHSALDTVRLMADNKRIKLQFDAEASIMIRGDATRLQQVVWNLLTNAIKFTPEAGQIEISLSDAENFAVLSVQDTGRGITSDFLPYVFESFRQEDASSTRKIGGLGLGLAITRHLVELHGGTIEVHSGGAGQGSVFIIKLPIAEPRFQAHLHPTDFKGDELPSLAGLHILAVDDEQDGLDFLKFLLESCGATVTAVDSVSEAMTALNRARFDLIVTDLSMPSADGFELIESVRSRSDAARLIPAIALTAYASEATQQQAILAGFQRHLVKPLNPDELIQTVNQLATTQA